MEYDQCGPPKRFPVLPGDLSRVPYIPDRRELLLDWDMKKVLYSQGGGLYMEPMRAEKRAGRLSNRVVHEQGTQVSG